MRARWALASLTPLLLAAGGTLAFKWWPASPLPAVVDDGGDDDPEPPRHDPGFKPAQAATPTASPSS